VNCREISSSPRITNGCAAKVTVACQLALQVTLPVKAASDVYAPIAGNIAAVNDDLADDPEKINADPYGDGWIVRMNVDGLDESVLMTPDDYQQLLDELDD